MKEFFRFPRTPHLTWLSSSPARDDKVLSANEVTMFLSDEVIIEEKVDGANLGFSLDDDGNLQYQSRGGFIDLAYLDGQWKPLRRWLDCHSSDLIDALAPDLMIFGEWCYAVHSIHYNKLPDFFLAFDVFDRSKQEFWSVDRRNELMQQLDLAVVPGLGRGRFSIDQLRDIIGGSRITDAPAEGIYLRRENGDALIDRAKIVRPEFVQNIGEHWAKRKIAENRLAVLTS